MASRDLVADINGLLKSAASQEKLARLVQYFCKFLKWYYISNGHKDNATKMLNLSNAMGMTRKVLRFPKTLEQYAGIRASFPLPTPDSVPNLIKLLKFVARLFLTAYFLFDHFMWMHKVNVIVLSPETQKRLQSLSDIGWVGEVSTNLVWLIIERATQERSITKDQKIVSTRTLVRNALDFPVAIHFWKPEWVSTVPEGVFGLLGAITSAISLYEMWPAPASK